MEFLEIFYDVLKNVANNDFFVDVNNSVEREVFFSFPFFLY